MKMKRDIEVLRKKIAAMSATTAVKKDSDGYYQPSIDKSGNGSAVLRYLPALPGEDFPFVRIFHHAFQVEGKWLIDNCPSTLNLACPVCEANAVLWKSGNKDVVSQRKRKMNYISNVLVVRDPKQSENDGKVMFFKYGVKIFVKLKDAIDPMFPDVLPMDPFDPYEGANFRLRITQNGNFRDYEKSSFDEPSEIGNEDRIASVLDQRQSLAEIVAPHQFKSYVLDRIKEAALINLSGSAAGHSCFYSDSINIKEGRRRKNRDVSG
jgi:hypothetical protein